MKTIPLTKGLVALVDDEDYKWAMQFKWYATVYRDGNIYVRRRQMENGINRSIRMHREIMNASPGTEVDHKNGSGLDNRRCNLRFCTRKQNQQNRKVIPRAISSFKGVRFRASRGKGVFFRESKKPWFVTIKQDGKKIHLGYFESKIDAAIAYNIAAIKHFGEFARLNPIPFTYA